MSHFTIANHIITGADALKESIPYLKKYGKKAFIVTGPHVGKSSMMTQLTQTLQDAQIDYYLFDKITGEPTDVMIQEGVLAFKKEQSDFLIGFGGGSPLDSAKAIAAMSVNPGTIADYNGKMITGNTPPIVAIPTTSGTGSETTMYTVITDQKKNIKMLLKGNKLVPDLAILCTAFTLDMPKSVTASTGLDALTHAVEAYTSRKASPLTDIFAISAVKRIIKYLPAAYQNGNDLEAREQMMLASFEAGVCINNSTVTLVHGMSRPIGALFHVPHGMSNAMLLPDCIEFALDGTYKRFAHLAREIGAATENENDRDASKKLVEKLKEIRTLCEIPSMSAYGIDKKTYFSMIDKMSDDAIASGSPGNTRKEISKKDCVSLYEKIYT